MSGMMKKSYGRYEKLPYKDVDDLFILCTVSCFVIFFEFSTLMVIFMNK